MSTTIPATARPIRELPADRFICQRCGIERDAHAQRPRAFCIDCKLAMRDARFLDLIQEGQSVRNAAKVAGLNSAYAYRLATPDEILERREALR